MKNSRPQKSLSEFRKELTKLIQGEFPSDPLDQIFYEMLFTVGKLQQEKFDTPDLRLLNTALKELRYSLKVFRQYRLVPKAAVFGSARTPKNHPNYKLAVEFGRELARKKWMLITGGAAGIMEAAMVGAGAKNCFGLNIMLPFEQSANPVIRNNRKLMMFKYFFTRKLMFLKESEATVLFPGGFGTFDEMFESFTLVQTGKARPRPLVLLDHSGSDYWGALFRFMKMHMEKAGLISPVDLTLMRRYHHARGAVDELVRFYKNYDSSRFFKDQYLIRLRKPVSEKVLAALSEQFKDILTEGRLEYVEDLSDDDNSALSLNRILFHFDRSSYSRLRQLIDGFNNL